MKVTEVRTAEWDQGTGFQLRFQASPETVLRVFKEAGFPIKELDKSVTDQGLFTGLEKSQGAVTLTCMRSNDAGRATDDGSDTNETGE